MLRLGVCGWSIGCASLHWPWRECLWCVARFSRHLVLGHFAAVTAGGSFQHPAENSRLSFTLMCLVIVFVMQRTFLDDAIVNQHKHDYNPVSKRVERRGFAMKVLIALLQAFPELQAKFPEGTDLQFISNRLGVLKMKQKECECGQVGGWLS